MANKLRSSELRKQNPNQRPSRGQRKKLLQIHSLYSKPFIILGCLWRCLPSALRAILIWFILLQNVCNISLAGRTGYPGLYSSIASRNMFQHQPLRVIKVLMFRETLKHCIYVLTHLALNLELLSVSFAVWQKCMNDLIVNCSSRASICTRGRCMQ